MSTITYAARSNQPPLSESQLLRAVGEALKEERLTLPMLPEVAHRISTMAAREDVTAAALAAEIGKDPAIAVRLLRVANSAAYRTGRTIESLQQAITRMGLRMTRHLVVALSMEQLYRARNPMVHERLQQTRVHSVNVAALSRVLASHCTVLDPEMAMLAGLVHDVGALPILRLAEDNAEYLANPEILDRVVDALAGHAGRFILQAWQLPVELFDVPAGCRKPDRRHDGLADYTDVVTVARLLSYVGTNHPAAAVSRAQVPAYGKLNLDPHAADIHHEVQGFAEQVEEGRAMLSPG